MEKQKPKIVIIEDEYRQFRIIHELLKHDFDIIPAVKGENQFKLLRSKLMRFLNEEGNEFPTELNDYKDVAAFIVDYKLPDDHDKTGILFCKKTECIANGSKPVLFLTISPDEEIEYEINRIKKNQIPNIIYKNLRKPKIWGKVSLPIESIINDSISSALKDTIIIIIAELIEKTKPKEQILDTAD